MAKRREPVPSPERKGGRPPDMPPPKRAAFDRLVKKAAKSSNPRRSGK